MNKISNKTIIRLIISLAIVLVLISGINLTVYADEEVQRVYDYAGVLNDSEIASLEELSEKYSQKRNIDFVILTTTESNYISIDNYAKNFVEENGFGEDYQTDKDHGCAIVTIGMTLRDVNVSGYGKAETQLDSNRCSLLREKITPLLSNGEYYKAFEKFIKTGQKYVTIKPGVNPNNIFLKLWFQCILALIIGAVTVATMAYNSGGKVTTTSGTYLDNNNSKTVASHDHYIRTSTTRVKRESSSSSGGGGGGGGGHSSSSGKF